MRFIASNAVGGPGRLRSTQASVALTCFVAFAASCGSKGDKSSGDDSRVAVAHESMNVVHVYNWADYIEPQVLKTFTEETGIRVVYDVYDSNEVLETKLLAGNTGYDVVVPSNTYLERQIKAGAFQKLDRTKLPNWKNLDSLITARVAQNDPGNQYAVNYMWGMNGIGYNEAQVRAVMPDAPVDSWRLVFDPKVAVKFKDCGISFLDSPADIVPVALIYLGKDPNSESEEDLKTVENLLLSVRPYIRMIHSSSYIDSLANGELCISVGWNGQILQARDRAVQAGQGHVIKYETPREGTISWFDMLAIPKDAPHPKNAHVFIDFMQRPDIAAANTNYIKYANGNAASLEFVADSVKSDPGIYPSAEVYSRMLVDTAESEPYTRLLLRSWTRFVTGR